MYLIQNYATHEMFCRENGRSWVHLNLRAERPLNLVDLWLSDGVTSAGTAVVLLGMRRQGVASIDIVIA